MLEGLTANLESLARLGARFNPEEPLATQTGAYRRGLALFEAQPATIQRFLQAQAHTLAETLERPAARLTFELPERLLLPAATGAPARVLRLPPECRRQTVAAFRGGRSPLRAILALRQRLETLALSDLASLSAAADLLRFVLAVHLVHARLPAGEPPAAAGVTDPQPFFLPQWAVFDAQDRPLQQRPLADALAEGRAAVAALQRGVYILDLAVTLAPYIVTDALYQTRRSGILDQLVQQGRACARVQVGELIAAIQRRAAAHTLNRGLNLSVPYFDDQSLEAKKWDFEVVPPGRVLFTPAFVVLAARQTVLKVTQAPQLNRSTRSHLLLELQMIELAFAQNES